MAISKEQIWEAADALVAKGVRPTLWAVREAVGGGSYTLIQAAMAEWRARNAAQGGVAHEPAPPFLEQRLTQVAAELWSAAREAGDARLAAEREALEQTRVHLDAARQEAAEVADQLTAQLEVMHATVASLQATEQAQRAELEVVRLKLVATEARSDESNQHAAMLRAECEQARHMALQAREQAAELNGRLQAVEAQNQTLIAQLAITPAG